MMNALLAQLSEPFDPKYLTWKPGSLTKEGNKCMAMAYADLRAYMERLDNVCGMDWSCRYVPWIGNKIICELTISGVTRSSTGDADAQDEKNDLDAYVAEASAFKRAAAMFGLGRFLYGLPSVWVDYDPQRKRISDSGKSELERRYADWYKKAMAAKRTVDSPTTDTTTGTQAIAPPPWYVQEWNRLTGKEYDLVQWVQGLHRKGEPSSAKQYQYLTGLVDALTGDHHTWVLSLLCQAEISSDNVPSKATASALLKILAETKKDESGETVANPDYRQDIAEMLTAITKRFAPVAA